MTNIAASFFARARAHPDAAALTCGGITTSFGAMAARVRRLAFSLRGITGARGARVVLCMENRAEFLELLFACWTAGLCAVPVNAKLHGKEVAQIAEDCGAAALFTSPALEPAIAAEGAVAPLHVVGSAAYARLAEAPEADCADAAPRDIAWLFYTSGTTGKSKGAMLSHRNLMAMTIAHLADMDAPDQNCSLVHAAPMSHGSGLYIPAYVSRGARQVVSERGGFE